jgi:ammonia channel protein AmtB
MCVAYFIFYLIGFGISTEAAGGIVGNGKAYGQDFESIDYTRWIISFGLCLISVQIQNSSMAERTHLGTHIIYSFYIAAIIYPVSASWVWGKGWLKQLGFVDFVGGGVVHMVSGFGGLVATIILEPRLEVISNLNRLQQQKLRRQVKIQVNEKKKQMRNVISNQVNQIDKDGAQQHKKKEKNSVQKQMQQPINSDNITS